MVCERGIVNSGIPKRQGVSMKNRNRFAWLIAAGLGLATYMVAALTVGSPFAEGFGFAVLIGSVVWFVRNGT